MKILNFLTIFTIFWWFLTIFTIRKFFDDWDYWKDSPGDLWHLWHWLQFLQLRTWIHDNLCYLTIKSDTGQHSQFLRCFEISFTSAIMLFLKKSFYKKVFDVFVTEFCINSSKKCSLTHLQSEPQASGSVSKDAIIIMLFCFTFRMKSWFYLLPAGNGYVNG